MTTTTNTTLTSEGATGDKPTPTRRSDTVSGYLVRYALQIFTVVAFLVVGVLLPNFRQLINLQDIFVQASFVGLSAAGMTLLIIGGVIDLSVAGIIALTAVTFAGLLPQMPLPVAVALSLGVGVVLGFVNGVLVTKLRFPPFIATYAMLNVYLAAAFVLTDAATVPVTSDLALALTATYLLGVPVYFLLLVGAAVACWLALTRTRFGRNLRAVGSSEAASRMAGLPADGTRITAYVIFGFLTSLAGVGLTSLLSSASADMSVGFELNVVAVAVVGGTSLLGGNGTLLGTVTAALLFAGLDNALNLFGVTSYWQYIAAGVVLAVALVVASRREAAARGRS